MPVSFDDLIPNQPANRPRVEFDDLIPQQPSAPVGEGLNTPTYLGQRSARGIADFLGAPVDLATGAVNAGAAAIDLGAELFGSNFDYRVKEPILGSDWIADNVASAYESAGGTVVPKEAVSPLTQVLGEGVRFGTAAAVPGAALAAKGPQMAKSMPDGSTVQRVVAGLSDPYKGGAAKQFAGDVGAGAGAGFAMEGYEDYIPESVRDTLGPIGNVIAAVLGAVGGSTATNAVISGGKAASRPVVELLRGADPDAPINPTTGRPHTRADMDVASEIAKNQVTNRSGALDNIDENRATVSTGIRKPEELPTTAMLADDVGLSLQENSLRSAEARPFIERDVARRSRASALVDDSVPKGAEGRNFTGRAEQIYDDTLASAKSNLDDAQARQAAAKSTVAQQNADLAEFRARQPDASRRLSDEFDNQLDAAQSEKNARYSSVPDDTPVQGQPIHEALAEVDAKVPRAAKLDGGYAQIAQKVRGLLEDVDPETGQAAVRDLTYGDVKSLRAEVNRLRKEIVASGGDVTYLDRIGTILSDQIDASNPDAARFYREEFAPRFRTGKAGEYAAAKKRAVKTGEQSSATRPEDFGEKFLRKGQDAASLQRAIDVDGNPIAASNAREWMLGDLAKSNVLSTDRADIRYDRFRKWTDRNKAVLDQFPEIRKEIDAELQKAADGGRLSRQLAMEVAEAQGDLADAQTELRRSPLHLALNKSPKNAVREIMQSGDPERQMSEMVRQLGDDQQALDGLKAATRDWIAAKAGTTARNVGDDSAKLSRANLTKLFNEHEKTLSRIYSPDEMNALRQAHKLLDAEAALDVKATGQSQTFDKMMAAQKDSIKRRYRILEGALKAKFGVLKGGGIFRTMNIFLETLPNKQNAIEDLLFEMHFNPDLAKHLLTRPTKEVGSVAYNKRLHQLLAAATGGRESGRGNSSEPETPRRPLEITVRPREEKQ